MNLDDITGRRRTTSLERMMLSMFARCVATWILERTTLKHTLKMFTMIMLQRSQPSSMSISELSCNLFGHTDFSDSSKVTYAQYKENSRFGNHHSIEKLKSPTTPRYDVEASRTNDSSERISAFVAQLRSEDILGSTTAQDLDQSEFMPAATVHPSWTIPGNSQSLVFQEFATETNNMTEGLQPFLSISDFRFLLYARFSRLHLTCFLNGEDLLNSTLREAQCADGDFGPRADFYMPGPLTTSDLFLNAAPYEASRT